MKSALKNKLIAIARKRQTKTDQSHDFQHILRTLNLAEKIGRVEKADLDIIIPAALFHDIVVYPKNTSASEMESEESALAAERILKKIKQYPRAKIKKVKICIKECSFSKRIKPKLLESKVLQDADRLEATGAISIMRTFSSGGQMNRPFYDPSDPFRRKKGPIDFRSNLDLFYERLLVVEKIMHTRLAKTIARRRTKFLKLFLKELELELKESKIV